jgi:hypothetical protein
MTLGNAGKTDFAGAAMKTTDLRLLLALCLITTTGAHADDSLTPTTDYSSAFNYYGADQPFAHPVHRAGEIGDDHGVHVGGEPGDDKRT